MTLYVGSREAARRLGVSRATLYAYVSRGLVTRQTGLDGKTSMYATDDLERLRARSRRREPEPRPSIDVPITSAVTRLDEHGLWYRDVDAIELARTVSYEQVAELLWAGQLPAERPEWPAAGADDLRTCRAAMDAVGPTTALRRLQLWCTVLATRHADDGPAAAARRLQSIVAAADGRRRRGPFAARLARQWHRRSTPELVAAIDRALVLLADHELATSTLATRVATSVRSDPYAAFAAGFATLSGELHGSAAAAAYRLLGEASEAGAAAAVGRRLDGGERLPGFGHTVYRGGDPRLEPLLEAAMRLPGADAERRAVVDQVLRQANIRLVPQPNVDLGLAVLCYAGDLDPDVPIFAVARLAGWAAHCLEELAERPVRFRGLARPTPPGLPAIAGNRSP